MVELLQKRIASTIDWALAANLSPAAPRAHNRADASNGRPVHSIGLLIQKGWMTAQDGNHGELHPTADDYVPSGVPFVMANNIRGSRVDLDRCKHIPMNIATGLRTGFARAGDVLLTHKGTLGETAILGASTHDFIVLTPQVTYYRITTDRLLPGYLTLVFRSTFFQEQMKLIAGRQSTRDYVSLLTQRELCIPVPPPDRQREITSRMSVELERLEALRALTLVHINLLQERRQAFIASAVAGDLDTPEAA